ncbi:hypothetical protein PUNSTDRAFT_136621 [Punctularia strigosozonata HHB-11173 SS5]|uniref:uncharacterized protein n=1 Tax=Punctularia strigosozonata (strain HHB-11173) TaxID=741275 RepID=UPI00044171CC|nr:uncharacterized protein PUNSTDRAFT_136621 [Punctularia strigosozonata HHB-11173 SS5]EIN06789.1 hypothetical protein PUNSTDRAFT_136621 [Punctularia strigosozonata HHB-11173 SS5]
MIDALLLACIIAGFATGTVVSSELFKKSFTQLETTYDRIIISTTAGLLSVADVLITVTVYYYIGTSRTGLRETDTVVESMGRYVITRGLLIVSCHGLKLVTFVALRHSLVFLLFHQLLSKLYCLTLFTLLSSFEPFNSPPRPGFQC